MTIDIINRKDESKNPLIYEALNKLINDYKIYKNNFPSDYYEEFGRFMVEHEIQRQTGILKILNSLINCCSLITESKIFGDMAYKNGGAAIFHLYENYIPKYNGDENGLDKVSHFLFSAYFCFLNGPFGAGTISVGSEIADLIKLKSKIILNKIFDMNFKEYGSGFNANDIQANNAGIAYGIELIRRMNVL